jgi:hypothetical protein
VKISDAIAQLQKIQAENGDLEIMCLTDLGDLDDLDCEIGFLADFDKVFEVIDDLDEDDKPIKVCAMMDQIEWIPEDPEPTKKRMTLVK